MSGITVAGSVSDPGDRRAVNEDVFGHTDRAAWVIDGATGLAAAPLLADCPSDAAWLAAAYSASFEALLRAEPAITLERLVAAAAEEVAGRFERSRQRAPDDPAELPSASMILVRRQEHGVEYARLGDCQLVFSRREREAESTRGGALYRLDEQVLRKMALVRARSPDLPFAGVRAAVRDDLRRNRRRVNRPGGYWALGLDPAAARHMETGSIGRADGAPLRMLLLSDGFYRLVDTFAVHSNASLLDAACKPGGLAALLAQLRDIEDSDPECMKLRFKQHDDATAVLVHA